MRGATLWLCTVMLLGGLMTGLNAQQGDPCRRCVTVLESRISCPTDATGNLTWTLVIRNDADFAISYGFVLQTPGNVNISPNPIFFNPPLQPGETRTLTFTVSGSYLGYSELCFDMVFYNSTLDRCCRLQTCVPLPRCCFIIREEQVVCDPHTGDFIYTFTLFNQFPAIVQYVVVLSDTPGVTVTPTVTVLNPPIGYLGTATVTVRIQGAVPGQTVRLRIGLLDFLGGFCCSIEHEVTMPPCCFEILDPVVECTDEGIFYEFTLKNWYPAPICHIVVFPQTQGVTVQPNPIQLVPPLGYGESRRIRLRVLAQGCGGRICLQLVLLDCMFRMCCSNSTCFEAPAAPVSRLWTTTQDFAEGEQDNVDISNDEIKLPREQTFEYPWVWITNYGPGTISKIDARTYREVARYYGPGGPVSRTAVDRFGNVWVECRGANAVIQILDERNWSLAYDFNGNAQLDTSRDLNGDGCIDPNTEMLPFGQDELVVRYYKLDNFGTFPRALAIDLNGYLWVGLDRSVNNQFHNPRLIQLDPNLPVALYQPPSGGTVPLSAALENLSVTQVPPGDAVAYGFVTAPSGYMYGAALFQSKIYEWCPGDPTVPGDAQITQVVTTSQDDRTARPYGIAVDSNCTIWAADWSGNGYLIKWDPSAGQAGMQISSQGVLGYHRGVNVDLDGNVWTSVSIPPDADRLVRWDPATLTPTVYRETCSSTHSGIGITFGGQIVNPSYRQQTVTFFSYDQNTNTITQTGCVNCPGLDPYNYNDFTGALLRYALNEGTWRTVYDGGCNDRIWGRLDWNAFIPEGTSITVRVRAGNSLPIQTEWTTVGNGEEFCLRGRYLEIEVRLSRTPRITRDCRHEQCGQDGEFITPILYDIRATSLCECTRQFGTVRGNVFCDSDRDGQQDANDRPLAGWAIVIEDQNGNQLTRFTDANGEYRFENIPDGEYRLVQMTPPGWLPIRPAGGETQIEVRQSAVRIDFANVLLGDVNGDQCVDDADLLAILFAFGSEGENLPEDVNLDGIVDDADLLYALFNFGVGC
jgi:streptogramin lyase